MHGLFKTKVVRVHEVSVVLCLGLRGRWGGGAFWLIFSGIVATESSF